MKLISKDKGELEQEYLCEIVNTIGYLGFIVMLAKLCDRIANLRTIPANGDSKMPEFQRKVFFSTLDTFVPEFVDKINFKSIYDHSFRKCINIARKIFYESLAQVFHDRRFCFEDSHNPGMIETLQLSAYLSEKGLPQLLTLHQNVLDGVLRAQKVSVALTRGIALSKVVVSSPVQNKVVFYIINDWNEQEIKNAELLLEMLKWRGYQVSGNFDVD
ncbi:MAG: hypothetical protein HZC15_01105, partial [Candidatus Omnitrophica bacterium]|nr:hypothetical protein [Candidatus Omnitrophota bacterium]